VHILHPLGQVLPLLTRDRLRTLIFVDLVDYLLSI
jgi:hypothetical protein